MKSEIDKSKNPIQANPVNPNNPAQQVDSKNVPKDKKPEDDKKLLVKEIEKLEKQVEGVVPGAPDGTGPKAGTPECPLSDEEKCDGIKKQSLSVKDYLSQSKEFIHQAGAKFLEGGPGSGKKGHTTAEEKPSGAKEPSAGGELTKNDENHIGLMTIDYPEKSDEEIATVASQELGKEISPDSVGMLRGSGPFKGAGEQELPKGRSFPGS